MYMCIRCLYVCQIYIYIYIYIYGQGLLAELPDDGAVEHVDAALAAPTII